MDEQEIIYRLALQRVQGIGSIRYKNLLRYFGSATAVFRNTDYQLQTIENIGTVHLNAIRNFNRLIQAEQEYKFLRKNDVRILFFDQDDYPAKLKRAIDSPPVLFYKGTDDIHNTRVLAVIGTRNNSDYGRKACEKIIEQVAPANPLIVSGLAYGIDALAHRLALQNNLATIGVMATGIDKIYPGQHRNMATDMMLRGGVLTEFWSGTSPDRENFPLRNRIVAGMVDAVIVIETASKGGSIITTNLADSYNRDVFCVPGRIDDKKSAGCNDLIKSLKAKIITHGQDVLDDLNWLDNVMMATQQRKMFVELSDAEKRLYETLQSAKSWHIDELFNQTSLSMSQLATLLLQLEMLGMAQSLPGKRYQAV